ncbi:MAG: hypothetical protein ABR502_11760, partial [Chitinophagaceae bacterium]
MKKIIFFLAMACFFTGFTAFAQPAVVTDTHFERDVAFNFTNPCNGENIDFTGHETNDYHTVVNKNAVNLSVHAEGRYDGTGDQGNTYSGHV